MFEDIILKFSLKCGGLSKTNFQEDMEAIAFFKLDYKTKWETHELPIDYVTLLDTQEHDFPGRSWGDMIQKRRQSKAVGNCLQKALCSTK